MTATFAQERGQRIDQMKALWRESLKKPKKLDANLTRTLEPGWLWPYLMGLDEMISGRWAWWIDVWCDHDPNNPNQSLCIPQISFLGSPEPLAKKSLGRALDSIPNQGTDSWLSMGAWDYLRYFLNWFLYGVGSAKVKELPREPVAGASMRLYQTLDLSSLLLWPYDYLGDMLAENAYGKRQGFYPTPHHVVQMMTVMNFADSDNPWQSVCDPAVGTGRMLLETSNYSLNLHGMDIDAMMCLACMVNAYLYVPWLACSVNVATPQAQESLAPSVERSVVSDVASALAAFDLARSKIHSLQESDDPDELILSIVPESEPKRKRVAR